MRVLVAVAMMAVAANAADQKMCWFTRNQGVLADGRRIMASGRGAMKSRWDLAPRISSTCRSIVINMSNSKPEEPRLARSLDGGETWSIEAPKSLLPARTGRQRRVGFERADGLLKSEFRDDHPVHRQRQGRVAAVLFDRSRGSRGAARTCFRYSACTGGVAARTDYVIEGASGRRW